MTDEEGFIYLAEDLEEGESALEETEGDLQVRKVHVRDALKMLRDDEITDSMSLVAILMVAVKLQLH